MQVKTLILVTFLMFSLVYSASALTVDIVNPRMVLRLSPGESAEKYFTLKNPNGIPVTVELSVSGDLAATTIIKESSFTLLPDREKNAYFVISPKNPGTFETKINVKYSISSGDGAGLAAAVIVISDNNSTLENNSNVTTNSSSFNLGAYLSNIKIDITPLILMYISTAILILILLLSVIYLFIVSRKLNKLRNRR